jgi:glycosyltransferase involved in cell wall biosynthesis
MSTNHDTPLLTIVIPTRNRLDYLRSSIRSVLAIPYAHLQLVVEDNSDSNSAETWINENISDERLLYHHSLQPVPMVENYERGMSQASGEYVCLIGDDDGVNPEIVDATQWAHANEIDALVPQNPAHFVWPDLQLRPGAIQPSELRIQAFSGRVSFLQAEAELRKCMQDAGQDFHGLPKSYYGIVRRSCMQQVKDQAGVYFPGVSPDMAAAVAVANVVDRICQIDYPLFLPGSSFKSNAGISGLKKHIGRLEDQPHLPTTSLQDWSRIVPAFYSVETVWAESVISALTAMGRNDLLSEFNVPRLYADCLFWHPQYYSYIVPQFYPALRVTRHNLIVGTGRFIRRYLYMWSLRTRSLLYRFYKRSTPHSPLAHSIANLKNIEEAVSALSEYLKSTGKRFEASVSL